MMVVCCQWEHLHQVPSIVLSRRNQGLENKGGCSIKHKGNMAVLLDKLPSGEFSGQSVSWTTCPS